MAVFPIRTFPDPVLTMQATEVTEFNGDLHRLVDDMFETMYEAQGVGLAAAQIGVSKRLFVADVGDGPIVLINPTVIETTGKWKFEEGCLSVPDKYWNITRRDYARVEGFDPDGNAIMYEGDELMGRMLQHETDHLQGILLLSHLPSRLKRQVLKELREESVASNRVR